MNLRTEQGKDDIAQSRADQLCGEYLSKNDFLLSKTQRAADRVKPTNATMLIVYSLTALLGLLVFYQRWQLYETVYIKAKGVLLLLRSVGLVQKGPSVSFTTQKDFFL